jgi:hypothetical protein
VAERSLIIFAAAEAANQVSYAKRNRGSRVRALLYRCTKEILGPAGGFVNNLDGIGGRLRRLSVCILQCPLQLVRLALGLAFYVACSSSDCVFNLTARVFGIPHNAIFIQ